MPNTFAYLALYTWPLVAIMLFRHMPPLRAMIWTILAGYLFLPTRTGIDLPLLPPFDKILIPSLTAAVLIWRAGRREETEARNAARRARQAAVMGGATPSPGPSGEPASGGATSSSGRMAQPQSAVGPISFLLIGVLLALPFGVFINNQEPVLFSSGSLPGMRLYDAFSMSLGYAVMLLPFLLGRRYLQSPDAHVELLKALAWGGLLYLPLMLIEIRMSPQLNIWLYGFFPHSSFLQHVRGGSYRPIVFLDHGLRVAIFMAMACLAAATLQRIERGWKWRLATLLLLLGVVLTRSLGALIVVIMLLPFVAFAGQRLQTGVAAFFALLVLFYPMARGAGLVPTETAISWAEKIDRARAHSLSIRIGNEDRLLRKANQKPLFGWGAWGRSRIYNTEGGDASIPDGIWVILMGVGGWSGYLAHFGLLCLPLLARLGRRDTDLAVAGLGLVLTANLIDMLPNSSLVPITWLVAGTLTGRLLRPPERTAQRSFATARAQARVPVQPSTAEPAPLRAPSRYHRQRQEIRH